MAEVNVDYLGGDPGAEGPTPSSGILTVEQGAMSFKGTTLNADLSRRETNLAIPADLVVAISCGSANHMRTLTRTVVGGAIGGDIGALIGALTGRRNHILLVAADRDGFRFFASFAIRGDEGIALLNAIQKGRHTRGEQPLPQVEELAGASQLDASERQVVTLERIEESLSEQNYLLRQILAALTPSSPPV